MENTNVISCQLNKVVPPHSVGTSDRLIGYSPRKLSHEFANRMG